jgi:hypothetical protein
MFIKKTGSLIMEAPFKAGQSVATGKAGTRLHYPFECFTQTSSGGFP